MAEGKERSALFKFLYTFLRIITFPIFMVLYVLKHPLWVALLLLIGGGMLVYYPMSNGVKLEDVPLWYKNKYSEVKLQVVHTAVEKGHGDMFSDEMLKDLKDEVEEQQGIKSENFNAKISRDETLNEKTSNLKKRGGFKRKDDVLPIQTNKPNADDEEKVSGGLEVILNGQTLEQQGANLKQTEENKEEKIVDLSQPKIKEQLPSQKEMVKTEDKADTELDEFGLF